MDPKFPPPEDTAQWAIWNTEVYDTMFRRVTVFPFETVVNTIHDNQYGEDLQQHWPEWLSYETPVYIAQLPGWKTKVTVEGVDEDRPLTLCFSRDLIEAQRKPVPTLGFLIFLQNEYYKVFQENPGDYFANLYRNYTHVVLVQRYRTESVSRGEITDATPPVERSKDLKPRKHHE